MSGIHGITDWKSISKRVWFSHNKAKGWKKRTEGEWQRDSLGGIWLFSCSMARLPHCCPSSSSLCSFQQLKCAPGSLRQSLLPECTSSGFSTSMGEPGASVRARQAGQVHSLSGPHTIFITCPWNGLDLKPVTDRYKLSWLRFKCDRKKCSDATKLVVWGIQFLLFF